MSILDFTIPPLPPLPRKPRNRQFKKWTTLEDNVMRDLFRQKLDDVEIAEALGRNTGAVANRRYTLKLLRCGSYTNRHCQDGGAKCSRSDSIRCLSCHHKAQAARAVENGSQYFSMRSEEEILPDGTRRRLYGDLRGI